eukprot:TRINITY_DN19974_c0_g1_i1.p2 TRINITY_DN19974_c0_g1~~TRINITY_DN19974_c0_g1_i1.p2  ORF type:complete len:319 (-),score=85.09 TRINITY_DN19974_c0_g1_i1:92-1048(-)
MLTDADLVAPSTARFLTGFSALLVLTKSSSFCDLLFTFSGSAAVAAPTVGLLLVVMALYALAGRDIFSDKVLTAYGDQAYFSSYGRALSTMFQIFVGDGWAAAMYAASDRTTEAARIFFVSFVAVIGLLVTELIVGVIVTIFSDVNAMQSTHVYGLLAKKGRSVDQTKKGELKEDILSLVVDMVPLYELLGILYTHGHDPGHSRYLLQSFFQELDRVVVVGRQRDSGRLALGRLVDRLLHEVDPDVLLLEHPWMAAFAAASSPMPRVSLDGWQKLDGETSAEPNRSKSTSERLTTCLLYTSDAADEEDSVDLGGRRII